MNRFAVLLFWLLAAALVGSTQIWLVPRSLAAGATATIGGILATAYGYTRWCAPSAGASHALGVGIAWLFLTVVTEVVMEVRLGHSWHALLGSTGHPLLRNIFLLLWVFAPLVFAHGQGERA